MQALTFKRVEGQLWADGVLIALAYSGNGAGLNNPAMDAVHNVGPLPAGKYTGELVDDPRKGPRVWRLTPDPSNDMKGRSAFMIHWDTHDQVFRASDGCIVPVMTAAFTRIRNEFELTVQ